MKKTALLVALSLTAIACDSESSEAGGEGELGSVSLDDSADNTGKADALRGREVKPYLTEVQDYGADTKTGKSTVVSLDDDVMTVEAPLVFMPAFDDTLQITISGDEQTDMRFFLVYDDGGTYRIATVEGAGEFEDGDEPNDGATQTDDTVNITHFQTVSINKTEGTISVASDGAGGQTTTDLNFDTSSVSVLALPVDSGEGNSLVGDFAYTFDAQCDGYECGEEAPVDPDVPVDDYAQARDVDLLQVTIGGDVIPYEYPSVDTGFGLGGTEFWQKWSGGHNPTYSYNEGTEAGRKCMLASAIRFEAIMSDPPEAMIRLKDETNWSGRFFNWNDDYSESPGQDARYAVLWAWRTGLIKWISQTAQDGTCYLPTRDIVESAAEACLARGASSDGEIEGCQG